MEVSDHFTERYLSIDRHILIASRLSKIQKNYIDSDNANLLLLCVEGDNQGSYFYDGCQAKTDNLKAAHNASLVGAQNAKTRSGYVCIF